MRYPSLAVLLALVHSSLALPVILSNQTPLSVSSKFSNTKVLILGGGVAGVAAARTLHDEGISNFVIVEARDELGGRMASRPFGASDRQYTVEVGANWVQGTQTDNGTQNPIMALAKKHGLATRKSSYFTSLTTYDDRGVSDFAGVFNASIQDYARLVTSAGKRVPKRLVDMTARSGYSLTGAKPSTRHEMAAEYYQFDWEFAASPEDTSWLASSWAHNSTFRPDAGGFSLENRLSVDQRGFKFLIQSEAHSFLKPEQVRLNSTVRVISASEEGVRVTLSDGETLEADYALCTFSLGVLQHDDVKFDPVLPVWKQEAIHSMMMVNFRDAVYVTSMSRALILRRTVGNVHQDILQFSEKFWFDTEMALYADYERGRYPVWQSLDHKNFFPGSGILFVTVTGDFSKRIELLPDSQVKSEVLSILRTMFPNTSIPEPLDFYFQRWHSDPLFRGAYSNWPASFLSEHQANLRANVDERLWFAGEATSRKHFGAC
ncbi:amine oxidase [Amylocystis lapponica]|nr:amine oxidase [Amylocystis lapponica]